MSEKVILSVQNPILLDEYSQPEPNLALLQPKEIFYEDDYPEPGDIFCLIGVADPSINYDRDIKAPLYAQAGIPEYLLLDLHARQIELYS